MSDTPPEAAAELPPVEVDLEPEEDSIGELFAREPDSWNEQDMIRLVSHLREKRRLFDLEAAKPKKTKAPATPKVALQGLSGQEVLARLGLKK